MAERTASGADLVPAQWLIPEEHRGQGALVVMRDGSFRLILRVGAVNIDLKDDAEQDMILSTWGQLLNSLPSDFALQVLCHSKRLDADGYLRQFERLLYDRNASEEMKRLAEDHRRHVEQRITQQNLLQREFYFVLPFRGVAEPVGERVADNMPGATIWRSLFRAAEDRIVSEPDTMEVSIARQQLDLRAGQIANFLRRIGIESAPLGEQKVIDLLYEMFNPVLALRQRGMQVDRGATPSLRDLQGGLAAPTLEDEGGGRRRRRRS